LQQPHSQHYPTPSPRSALTEPQPRPWENGYNERFNGTLRKEVLNAEWFHTTKQAQVVINAWLRQYNQIRPHHALNMRPPVPETLLEKPKINGRI
jgi:transposase InsO family protein